MIITSNDSRSFTHIASTITTEQDSTDGKLNLYQWIKCDLDRPSLVYTSSVILCFTVLKRKNLGMHVFASILSYVSGVEDYYNLHVGKSVRCLFLVQLTVGIDRRLLLSFDNRASRLNSTIRQTRFERIMELLQDSSMRG